MLAAAGGCFAAGTGVGLLIPRFAEPEAMPRSAQEEFRMNTKADNELVCKLAADHGLTERQARSLRLIMQNQREQELTLRLSAKVEELPPATQSRVLWLRNQTTQRIRVVLDPQQRARYDRESRSGPNVGPEHGGPSTATNR
ncbi:MAG TPA: hypothetical protein VFD82_02955 [Planctomycetota bacterium]|nr:hypothetical protein [Planctomycetota bacterium]